MKALVVFYSRTGHTKRIAAMIAELLKADIEELVDKRGRRGLMGFLRGGWDAMKQRSTELEPLNHRPGDYDLIFVGTPVWASRPAPAVRTFLESQDLRGKKVALFCTMSGGGEEATFATMKALLSGAEVVGQLALVMKKEVQGQIEEKVNQWVVSWKGQN